MKKSFVTKFILISISLFLFANYKAYGFQPNAGKSLNNYYSSSSDIFNSIETILGMSDEDLIEAVHNGLNAYDLAQKRGISPSSLKRDMLNAKFKEIDLSVANGTLSKAKAQTYKENFKNQITAWHGEIILFNK
jgi:hypothetical protein